MRARYEGLGQHGRLPPVLSAWPARTRIASTPATFKARGRRASLSFSFRNRESKRKIGPSAFAWCDRCPPGPRTVPSLAKRGPARPAPLRASSDRKAHVASLGIPKANQRLRVVQSCSRTGELALTQ